MKSCQIKIKNVVYNIFEKLKNKKKKSFDTFKDEIRVVVWENESPVDSFYMFQGSNKSWTAWTANTISQSKIELRLELQEYLNEQMAKEIAKEFDKTFSKEYLEINI